MYKGHPCGIRLARQLVVTDVGSRDRQRLGFGQSETIYRGRKLCNEEKGLLLYWSFAQQKVSPSKRQVTLLPFGISIEFYFYRCHVLVCLSFISCCSHFFIQLLNSMNLLFKYTTLTARPKLSQRCLLKMAMTMKIATKVHLLVDGSRPRAKTIIDLFLFILLFGQGSSLYRAKCPIFVFNVVVIDMQGSAFINGTISVFIALLAQFQNIAMFAIRQL